MSFIEACLHTRNYGCRIRRFQMNGIEMLSLENDVVKIVISLGKGADIVEFVHKATDIDFMWHSFNEQKNITHPPTISSEGGTFFDAYAGGWQELFPTYGESTTYDGSEIGIHGEACIYPWECKVLLDSPECICVELALRTIRTPYLLKKKLTLKAHSGRLEMEQSVTNLAATTQQFMWAHHPAFGYPFLDESVEIRLKGTPCVTVPEGTAIDISPFDKETTGKWPILQGRNDEYVDMSRAHAAEEKLYMEYYVSDLEEGIFELVNTRLGIGMRMDWDLDTFKYLWIWVMYCGMEDYPWYGRAYTLGVEPWSTVPADYATAVADHTALVLEPGETRTTWLMAEAFTVK